jgi:hypothetical protein
MNHLGLIGKLEEILGKLPIINRPKCCSCWSVLAYGIWSVGFSDLPIVLAVSFLASYTAIWLELLEGFIDTLYLKLYDKIYNTSDDSSAADASNGNSAGSVSGM